MKQLRTSSRGFSLLELIVAVTIIGVLLSVGISSYRSWIQNSRVRSAATAITQGIQLARATAIKNNTRASFDLTGTLLGVNTTAAWNVCSNTDNRPCLNTDIVDQFAAAGQLSQIQVSVTNSVTCLEFNGMGRRTTTPRCNLPAGTVMQMEISNPTAGTCQHLGGTIRCLWVRTDGSGTTRMCDPAVSAATNPAGCPLLP